MPFPLRDSGPIGVFDSGIGGLSILKALQGELPGENFVYLADNAYAPYGERGDAFVTERTLTIAQYLRVKHQIKALVIACNTATAAAIHHVRAAHPDLPVIGVEPALKPALTLSKTQHIGVMATRGTVESSKFQALVSSLQGPATFTVQACDGLAAAIEQNGLQSDPGTMTAIKSLCIALLDDMGAFGNGVAQMDTLVLGCTHYPFIAPLLQTLVGNTVQLVDNGQAVARQTRRLLSSADRLSTELEGTLQLRSTGNPFALLSASNQWLERPGAAESTQVHLP